MSSTLAAEPARPTQGGVVVPLDARRRGAGRPAERRRPRSAPSLRPHLRLLMGGAAPEDGAGRAAGAGDPQPGGELTLERFLARARLVLAEDERLAGDAVVLPLRRRA